ncbi:MAG: FAD-binding oxidoreductase [Spirochaetia bacterium]|nr:FAD-binding oxidoreductase [Spirochaetia bacterium]
MNIYKPSNPWRSFVTSNTRITSPGSPDDIRHITLDISKSGMNCIEGQSIGVIVPGVDEEGNRHRVRLYSVSSPREGETSQESISLTIKRVFFTDEITGQIKKGVASNYICDLQPGQEIYITGPVGRSFILPEDNESDIIMIAVGTGIAPFRAFIHHMYKDKKKWAGQVLLFFGAKSGLESLYMNDQNNDIGQYYTIETFKAFQALSGDKKYVQHQLRDNIEVIWDLMKRDNFSLYICGLKGVEAGITEVFNGIAVGQGLSWPDLLNRYKTEKRWHIEVY